MFLGQVLFARRPEPTFASSVPSAVDLYFHAVCCLTQVVKSEFSFILQWRLVIFRTSRLLSLDLYVPPKPWPRPLHWPGRHFKSLRRWVTSFRFEFLEVVFFVVRCIHLCLTTKHGSLWAVSFPVGYQLLAGEGWSWRSVSISSISAITCFFENVWRGHVLVLFWGKARPQRGCVPYEACQLIGGDGDIFSTFCWCSHQSSEEALYLAACRCVRCRGSHESETFSAKPRFTSHIFAS